MTMRNYMNDERFEEKRAEDEYEEDYYDDEPEEDEHEGSAVVADDNLAARDMEWPDA